MIRLNGHLHPVDHPPLTAEETEEANNFMMPERCREVFTLTRDQGLTYAEVAALLRISPKTVETHMGRALAFLRRRLAPWLS